MTATALAGTPSAPRPTRSRPTSGGAVRPDNGPRLLLPPTTDPAPTRDVPAALQLPLLRSVLSPVTEAAWQVPGRQVDEPDAPLPDPLQLCGAVVLAAVEALHSTRPLAQLARWVSPEVYEALARARQPAEATGRAVVRGLRVCRISPTVAEGTAVVHDGTRARAAAVRFEAHRGSWRATVLQIG